MKKEIIYGCEGILNNNGGEKYLTRYKLIETKNWKLCLHVFHRSDLDDLHDHPWGFKSLILWNGYLEHMIDGIHRRKPLQLLHRKPESLHRIELINNKPAVTLVLMGKRVRDWGFVKNNKWIFWKNYLQEEVCKGA